MSEELVPATPSTQDIAERGEAIYGEKYCVELERKAGCYPPGTRKGPLGLFPSHSSGA